MENSTLGSGFLSSLGGGVIDIEPPVHRHQQVQLGHSSNPQQHRMQPSMNMMTGREDDRSIGPKSFSLSFGKGKGCARVNDVNHHNNNNMSEEDELEDGNGENLNGLKGKKGSPWQRMKWTDNIVRLLIQVVACVGDDGDGVEGMKRRSGILQKKGKWKTVSKILINKGCHVSPQQCEDKFNDLNKRYKRLNDILGRGTSCRVVENPTLMDTMPQLSNKMKEDVKKILSSKHLFYKEMCAYHNGQPIPNCGDLDLQVHSLPAGQCSKENNAFEPEEAEENDESEDDDDDSDSEDNNHTDRDVETADPHEQDENFHTQLGGQDAFQAEVVQFFRDPAKSKWEQREWVKKRILDLEDQRIGIQAEGFELEKQRFKWKRFCTKKDREMEMSKLENERLMLENERMVLLLKHKELEMDSENPGASFTPAPHGINRPQGRDQIDLGRHHQ